MISIDYGSSKDVDSWMRLVRTVSSSFPGLETEEALSEHRQTVLDFMDRRKSICQLHLAKNIRHIKSRYFVIWEDEIADIACINQIYTAG